MLTKLLMEKNAQFSTEFKKIKSQSQSQSLNELRKKIRKSSSNSENKLEEIMNKYRIDSKIGQGAFGYIYKCYSNDLKFDVAIKFEKNEENKPNLLKREFLLLQKLKNHNNFPKIYEYKEEDKFSYLAMSLLGPNLEDLLKRCGGRFSLKTVLMIGIKMINLLKEIHELNFLYRDLKPENIVIGNNEDYNEIFLIDFGLVKPFKDEEGNHIPFQENKGFAGTLKYASINIHMGIVIIILNKSKKI